MIAADQKTDTTEESEVKSLMAARKEEREQEALDLMERIRMIVMNGDSVEIKGRSDGTLCIYAVRKKREAISA